MKATKILAYYLPAFHSIPENNMWYGKGFTEWDNTKKALPLFKNHNQPRIPLVYYDLSNVSVAKTQMKLAKNYGIDGFVYYHYWFNPQGRKILEKPAEMMRDELENEEKLDYCFCWANQEWRKTWHEGRGTTSELLIEQEYGEVEDWESHLNYLLPFFKDDKYLKNANRPVFMILRPEDIPNYNELISYWNEWARNNGFDGMYFIRMRNSHRVNKISMNCDAVVDFEPNYTVNCPWTYSCGNLWRLKTFIFWHLSKYDFYANKFRNKVDYIAFNKTMRKKKDEKGKYYLSCFVDWDNSPRKGRRGMIFNNASPEQFGKELDYYYRKSQEMGNEYLFCFAWNEWGEGGYLEPDTKYGYQKLEAVKKVKDKYSK